MFEKLLSAPSQFGKAGRFVILQTKLWSHCAILLKKNRSAQQAAALSYYTLFGIVPLAIAILLIFQLFPAHREVADKVKALIYDQLHLSTIQYSDPDNPQAKINVTEHLDKIINSYFSGVSKGSVAIISVIFIIWAAIGLLSTIEKAFNNIWHVTKGRSFLHQIINYWALLTLGPLLLGGGIYAAAKYSMISRLEKTIISHVAPELLSYFIAVVLFFFLYFLVPHTKVNARAAMWGAAAAAFVWSIAKWGFKIYVSKYIPYNEVYGVLGLVPLSVFWIFITWLIILFGLQLAFTTQHLSTLDAAAITADKKREGYFIANDMTAINIVREIASAFARDCSPVESEVIAANLNIPAEFTEKLLAHLVNSGIIVRTSEPKTGFVPARLPEHIRLSDITAAVAKASFAQPSQQQALDDISRSQQDLMAKHDMSQLIN